MQGRIINLILIVTSLLGYLEWGENGKMFLFQLEKDIFLKLFSDPLSVMHPFILLPLIGQLLLIITLFQKEPGKWLSMIGLGCIEILMLVILAIGIMNINFKMFFSTIPFLYVGYLSIKYHMQKSKSLNS